MDERIRNAEIEAAKHLENAVNDMAWKGDDFVEQICFHTHRTLQANIFRTCLKLIQKMGSDEYFYDLRNEACHTISKQIIDSGALESSYVPHI